MNIKAGMLLHSTGALEGSIFENTLVYLAEYNSRGAVGFVVNRPLGRSLNELEEFKQAAAFALHDGGPVDTEHLFFLHRRPDLVGEGTPVARGVFLGGNFSQVVAGITRRQLTASEVRIFVGYCGWDAGDLEAEIAEGSWTLQDEGAGFLFS